MERITPYPVYKPSGVEWLGNVPAHWEVRRLRNIADVRFSNVDKHSKKHESAVRLCNYLDVYHNDRIRSNMDFMRATATDDEVKKFGLVTGDVLITKDSETWNDIGVPALVASTAPSLVCGYHLALIRPKEAATSGGFLNAALSSPNIAPQLHICANGVTRFGLSQNAIKSTWLPLPPLPEQHAIVRFLDHANHNIRRYIDAKQRLIGVLEEQRRAIIQRVVTLGLDPDVSLKDSGVGWLGEVPVHWSVIALRHRYSQCLGKMLDSKRIKRDHSLPYLRNSDIQWDRININDLPKMDILPDEYDRYTVRDGDLLVCEGGEVGRCALWSGELSMCGFQKALHRLRPKNINRDIPRFMYYVLRAAVSGNAFSDGHVSTIEHLTGEKIRAYRFPFPPFLEQSAIVAHLDKATASIDTAIERTRRQIELMEEYRIRLISDVVTGKLDVREAAAQLPEQPKRPEKAESGQ